MSAGFTQSHRADSGAPIFTIHLRWQRLPDSGLLAVRAEGLMNSQLRHYARRTDFRRVTLDSRAPAMAGTIKQRDMLLCELESAGYIIEEDYP